MLLRAIQNLLSSEKVRVADEFNSYMILGAEIALEQSIRRELDAMAKAMQKKDKEESEVFDPNAGSE
jgi:hypothetical protein